MMFATAAGFGAGLMAFSLSGNIYSFIGVLLFVNACGMAVDTLYKTLMQDAVSDEERGRAMGSWVLSIGFAPGGPRRGGRAGRGRGRAPGPAHQRRGSGRHQRRIGRRPAAHTAAELSAEGSWIAQGLAVLRLNCDFGIERLPWLANKKISEIPNQRNHSSDNYAKNRETMDNDSLPI